MDVSNRGIRRLIPRDSAIAHNCLISSRPGAESTYKFREKRDITHYRKRLMPRRSTTQRRSGESSLGTIEMRHRNRAEGQGADKAASRNKDSRENRHARGLDRMMSSLQLMKRAQQLLQLETSFIYSPEFESLSTERVEADVASAELFQPSEDSKSSSAGRSLAEKLDHFALLSEQGERLLFRKMNFLRYRSNVLRASIDLNCPDEATLDVIDSLIEDALRTRSLIVESNLRLVASIAGRLQQARTSFEELFAEGNVILLKAVDRFDYSRGFRFSTYATLAVQRHLLRLLQKRRRERLRETSVRGSFLNDVEQLPRHESSAADDLVQLERLWSRAPEVLDERERFILAERFGLNAERTSRSLREVSESLGISKERVRQIQSRACDRLFALAIESGFVGSAS